MPTLDLNGTFWSTLIGAVVGAVAGGLISFLIQVNAVRIARKERLAAKRQKDLAIGHLAMVKVIRMLSRISHIHDEITTNAKVAADKGKPLWQTLPPFATVSSQIEFADSERAFILATKEKALMGAGIELADVHNNLLQLVGSRSSARRRGCPSGR